MKTTRRQRELVRENDYAAEVEVDWVNTDDGWSPYLSADDARKLDSVRRALRRGDIAAASKLAKVYRVTPISAV